MCALCGVIGGGEHWTDAVREFHGPAPQLTRTAERQARVRLVNRILEHYGLSAHDWAGASYVLKSRTGQSAIVPNLTELWAAAEYLAGRPCDPLDAGLMAHIAARHEA